MKEIYREHEESNFNAPSNALTKVLGTDFTCRALTPARQRPGGLRVSNSLTKVSDCD
jgi:hypothetical protein